MPGLDARAIALPDGRLAVATMLDSPIEVPPRAVKIAVRPRARGVVALLADGTLVTTEANTVRAKSTAAFAEVDALAVDAEDRVWLARRSKANDELIIEILDEELHVRTSLPLDLFTAQGADILVDPSSELAAVCSHYGQEGSLLTMVRRSGHRLEILETWPSDDDGWADVFDVDGFHTTTNEAYRESAGAPPALLLVARLSGAIALVLCPDLAVGIDAKLGDGETCTSARIFGGSLWLTIEGGSSPADRHVRKLDPDSMSLRAAVPMKVPEHDNFETVGDGLVLTCSSNDWGRGYRASLWALDP